MEILLSYTIKNKRKKTKKIEKNSFNKYIICKD